MDSLTQIVLGAATGEVLMGRQAGNKAIFWGALVGTIPDFDVFARYVMEPIDAMIFHRGFMHSLFFCLVFAPVMGYIINSIHKFSWHDWTIFSFWCLFTHPLLDIFTTWGTQLFWPLQWRVTFNSVFVVDPLYTVPLMVFLIRVMREKKDPERRARLNRLGLIISTAYLFWALAAKLIVQSAFQKKLDEQHISYYRLQSKPMPLTTFYWEGLAETKYGFYSGHYSLFGYRDDISFHYTPKNHELAEEKGISELEDFKKLVYFSEGYYALTESEGGLDFWDMRFGMSDGIVDDAEPRAMFIYHLQKRNGELVLVHREAKVENTFTTINEYLKRVAGGLAKPEKEKEEK